MILFFILFPTIGAITFIFHETMISDRSHYNIASDKFIKILTSEYKGNGSEVKFSKN
jgi:hypothetical protein